MCTHACKLHAYTRAHTHTHLLTWRSCCSQDTNLSIYPEGTLTDVRSIFAVRTYMPCHCSVAKRTQPIYIKLDKGQIVISFATFKRILIPKIRAKQIFILKT